MDFGAAAIIGPAVLAEPGPRTQPDRMLPLHASEHPDYTRRVMDEIRQIRAALGPNPTPEQANAALTSLQDSLREEIIQWSVSPAMH